ncbi:glycosyltransferase family 39 protein [Candidatus Pelagibacter sp.]|nr:glycosyltransferase family 39 protein [Candidatus Pelagibacter sp.]
MKMAIYKKNISNIFYIFVSAHLIIWTLVPSLTNNNLPLDTIEALAWGSNLDWGFNKHPPMSAFLPEIFYQIFGPQDWAYYLLSQICIAVSFLVVFKLGEDFFDNKIYCLLSVLLLEGIYFYNFTTPEFNVNVCLIPFWSLSVYYLWRGIKNNKITDWLLLGLFAGLGFLSKYLFVYLGLAIDVLLIYMIYTKRLNLKCLVSFVPFIIILLPHIIWLTENDYTTITYGLLRTGSEEASILNHIKHPAIFLGKQIGILLPFLLMIFVIVKKFRLNINLNDEKLLFLLSINLIPIFFIFLTSFTMGVKIRTMWMTPFYISFGLLFVYILKSEINFEKMRTFSSIFLILFLLSPILYSYVSITKTDKRTDFEGKNLAKQAKVFFETEGEELGKMEYIKGNEWIGGNISYHLPERPKWIYSSNEVQLCNKDMKCLTYK